MYFVYLILIFYELTIFYSWEMNKKKAHQKLMDILYGSLCQFFFIIHTWAFLYWILPFEMKLKKKSQYFPINQTFFAYKNKPHTQIYICLEEFNSKSNWKWRVTLKWRNFSHFLHFFDIIFQSLSREELFSLKCHHIYMHKWFSVFFFA